MLFFSLMLSVGLALIASYITELVLDKSITALDKELISLESGTLDKRLTAEFVDEEFEALTIIVNSFLQKFQSDHQEATIFTGNAAHELKTPLTILQGKIDEAIRHEEPGSDRQARLHELLEEVSRLKTITERLLLLSRADSGELDLYLKEVDLSEILKNLAEDAQVLAPKMKIDVSVPEHIKVDADRALLLQVLHNLLSNAIKYNHSMGFVRVSLAPRKDELHLRFTNSGEPIPEEYHDRIFDRFYRVKKKRKEGAGLGLSLARDIARAHRGELILESSDERGTVFLLVLPARPFSEMLKNDTTQGVVKKYEGNRAQTVRIQQEDETVKTRRLEL